jgi:hypothetical protein
LSEAAYSALYAQLCQRLDKCVTNFEPNGSTISTFRKLLLTVCQHEFDNRGSYFNKNNNNTNQIKNTTDNDKIEQELANQAAKKKMLGNVKFIGELGRLDLLSEAILHKCIKTLLEKKKEEKYVDMADDLECLCKIMPTIGKKLDQGESVKLMDQYFERMKKLRRLSGKSTTTTTTNNVPDSIPQRIKFLLQDCIDLREAKWQLRQVYSDQTPKTMHEVRNNAFIEEMNQNQASARQDRLDYSITSAAFLPPPTTVTGSMGTSMLMMNMYQTLSKQPNMSLLNAINGLTNKTLNNNHIIPSRDSTQLSDDDEGAELKQPLTKSTSPSPLSNQLNINNNRIITRPFNNNNIKVLNPQIKPTSTTNIRSTSSSSSSGSSMTSSSMSISPPLLINNNSVGYPQQIINYQQQQQQQRGILFNINHQDLKDPLIIDSNFKHQKEDKVEEEQEKQVVITNNKPVFKSFSSAITSLSNHSSSSYPINNSRRFEDRTNNNSNNNNNNNITINQRSQNNNNNNNNHQNSTNNNNNNNKQNGNQYQLNNQQNQHQIFSKKRYLMNNITNNNNNINNNNNFKGLNNTIKVPSTITTTTTTTSNIGGTVPMNIKNYLLSTTSNEQTEPKLQLNNKIQIQKNITIAQTQPPPPLLPTTTTTIVRNLSSNNDLLGRVSPLMTTNINQKALPPSTTTVAVSTNIIKNIKQNDNNIDDKLIFQKKLYKLIDDYLDKCEQCLLLKKENSKEENDENESPLPSSPSSPSSTGSSSELSRQHSTSSTSSSSNCSLSSSTSDYAINLEETIILIKELTKSSNEKLSDSICYLIEYSLSKTDFERSNVSRLFTQLYSSILNKINNSNDISSTITTPNLINNITTNQRQPQLNSADIFINGFKMLLQQITRLEVEYKNNVKSRISEFIAKAICDQIFSLNDLTNLMKNGNYYPLYFLCMQNIHKIKSPEWLRGQLEKYKINLVDMLATGDKSKERLIQILEDRELSFVYPMLKIESSLFYQIFNDELSNEKLNQWILLNVDENITSSGYFIQSLVTCIVKNAAEKSVLNEDNRNNFNLKLDKTLVDKQKKLIQQYQV